MADFIATRNTCFALISSIEDDFRSLLRSASSSTNNLGDLLPKDVREVASKRRLQDLRMESISEEVTDTELLTYIDFSDIAKVLESKISPHYQEDPWIKLTAQRLVALTSTRNRVCHTRPLEPDDLPKTLDFAHTLVDPKSPFHFPTTIASLSRLSSEPTYVLTLQIPSFWQADVPRINNNLPLPEFDETGFLGRTVDRQQLIKRLHSHYPVVSIIGEGGIGKTALALRCLYDLLEDPHCKYDAIVWISLKTSALVATGVTELAGAIKSTIGVLSEIANQLGTPRPYLKSTEELIDEISEYLNLYKIIIAIDNLETISVGELRELLGRVPAQSKVLITSRVPVGEFEARYPLTGLDEKTAIKLFRSYSQILKVDALGKLDDSTCKKYCGKLFQNPLLIKWFVASVGRGLDPVKIINTQFEHFKNAISFCFDNLFDKLDAPERKVIDCLASARRPLSSAEINFLCPEMSSFEIELALSALHNTSIVLRKKPTSDSIEYILSESALNFLSAKAPPAPAFFKAIQSRLRELKSAIAEESVRENRYDYDPYFVRCGSNKDEMVASTYLRAALDHLKKRNYTDARRAVNEAKRLAPSSSECWRIGALVEENDGELFRAVENYEQAVGLNQKSKISKYCFGMFLLSDLEDFEGALLQFEGGLELEQDAPAVLTAKALALTRLGKAKEAADIHEKLLPKLKHRERRWRITGTDQAADCYRKWAFQEWEMREYDRAKSRISRAISILLESVERGDVDEKLLERAARVANEALSRRELTEDLSFVEQIIEALEKLRSFTHGAPIPIISQAERALKNLQMTPIYGERLRALDRIQDRSSEMLMKIVGSPSATERETRTGTIHNINREGRYGFIIELNSDRWFFHQNFLISSEEWESLHVGCAVNFELGQNNKGICAVDVQMAT